MVVSATSSGKCWRKSLPSTPKVTGFPCAARSQDIGNINSRVIESSIESIPRTALSLSAPSALANKTTPKTSIASSNHSQERAAWRNNWHPSSTICFPKRSDFTAAAALLPFSAFNPCRSARIGSSTALVEGNRAIARHNDDFRTTAANRASQTSDILVVN